MIYTASKTKHASKWRYLRSVGLPIISTWIDEALPGQTSDFEDLWTRCLNESAEADVMILYREPGEELKGAWVELGAALTNDTTVFAVGIEEFTIGKSNLITHCLSLEQAIAKACEFISASTEMEERERKAKAEYNKYVDNSGIHCNRFPSWEELSLSSRQEWFEKVSP